DARPHRNGDSKHVKPYRLRHSLAGQYLSWWVMTRDGVRLGSGSCDRNGRDLRNFDRTAVAQRFVSGLDDGHSMQIVGAAGGRLRIRRGGVHNFGHGPQKRVGKPDFVPAWRKPNARLGSGGEGDRARSAVWITGPADGALRESIRAFDAPLDIGFQIVARAARSGPHVVPGRGQQAIRVFERV